MSRVLQLRYVLQFIVDGLYHGPLAKEHFVGHTHQAVSHIVPHLGYHLYFVDEQPVEQFLGYVALVVHEFAI